MKRFLTVITIILAFHQLKASPQAPDFLIIERDTVALYFLPLSDLDKPTREILFNALQIDSVNVTTSLWRGYQAYWQLIANKLYLVGFKGCKDAGGILKKSFPTKYGNGKVFADWFSSRLALPGDKLLKWDGVFRRTYYREKVLDFKHGVLVNTEVVNNYIHVKNGISRLDEKAMTNAIFKKIKKLNWKKLSDCDCDDRYQVTINEDGKIGDINFASLANDSLGNNRNADTLRFCIDQLKAQLKDMQFDIIRWNGDPYSDRLIIDLFYDKRLENWSYL